MTEKEITIPRLIEQNEQAGIQYFKNLIRKSNQFSTKYILQKVLKEYQAHVDRVREAIGTAGTATETSVPGNEIKTDLDQLASAFDLETLNFVEATKLAIRMTDSYLAYYRKLMETVTQPDLVRLFERILNEKQKFLEQLHAEYERIRYKK